MSLKEKTEDLIVSIIRFCIIQPYFKHEDKLVSLLVFIYKKYDKMNDILASIIFIAYKMNKKRLTKKRIEKIKKDEFLNSVKIESD